LEVNKFETVNKKSLIKSQKPCKVFQVFTDLKFSLPGFLFIKNLSNQSLVKSLVMSKNSPKFSIISYHLSNKKAQKFACFRAFSELV